MHRPPEDCERLSLRLKSAEKAVILRAAAMAQTDIPASSCALRCGKHRRSLTGMSGSNSAVAIAWLSSIFWRTRRRLTPNFARPLVLCRSVHDCTGRIPH